MVSQLKKRAREASNQPDSENDNIRKSQKTDIGIKKGNSEQLNTIYGLIDARAAEAGSTKSPSILYPSTGTEYLNHSALDLCRLSKQAASYYSHVVSQRTSSDEAPMVVALLGPSTFEYLITVLALSRLGHTVLLLSTRLSEDAHCALIEQCAAKHLVVHDKFNMIAKRISSRLPGTLISRMAPLDDIVSCDPFVTRSSLDAVREQTKVALIIHSSGSTSLPKPNYYTHAAALGNFKSQFGLVGFVTLPLFHMQGLGFVFRSIMNRQPIYMWNADLPLTSQHLTKVLREHDDIQILIGVPYVMKLLADSEEGTALCRRLDVLLCGGGACSKPVGDFLTSHGVYLVSLIGSSETGQLMNSYRPEEDFVEWDWLRPSEELQNYLRWEPYDAQNDIFEMVVLEGWPSKVATNRDDGAYATKDLWQRHPDYPKKNAWRYYARKDDTIVLSNGEKANPILFEESARQCPLVDDAIAFGTEKPHLGIFLLPSATATDHAEVIDAVWPLLQRANVIAPAHAQIHRDMIRIMDLEQSRAVKRTDKSTVIRPAFYRDFKGLIDEAYKQRTKVGSLDLTRGEIIDFLTVETKALLDEARQHSVDDNVDLFSLGIDSLQASRLRSAILKNITIGETGLAESFVFDYPSIDAMATEILRSIGVEPQSTSVMSVEAEMRDLVDKYSRNFTIHNPSAGEEGDCVLVTGATGSLGAHIVAQLASDSKVQKVYCLIRAASDEDAHDRLLEALRVRGRILHGGKVKAFAADFTRDRLGVSEAVYTELAEKVTSVIHSAWNVNFNLSLGSFELDCIKGTRSLVDLCLQARSEKPSSLVFCSSVSTVARTPGAAIPEEPCAMFSYAQNMGYAQSKLVAENICLNASREARVVCRVLRIGQIVGDTECGIWNRSEAVPMIIRSADTVQALPELDEQLSWLPVDVVAKTVIECKDATLDRTTSPHAFEVLHVVNEHRLNWSKDLLPMLRSTGLQFDIVPRQEWLKRLRGFPDPSLNPPYRLIDFFTAKYGGGSSEQPRYRTEKARDISLALRQYSVVDQSLVNKFVRHILDR